jgi:hypothetical protein
MPKALELFFILAAVVGGPLLAVMAVPAFVKRFLSPREPARGGGDETELELESLSRRVAELEERVDFAERLLAQQRDAALPKPRP